MNLRLTLSVDDVHPEKGWMIIGDKTEKWFNSLHESYGVKFNLFIPSCYHNKYPISQYKSWINELNSDPKFACEAHGHFHMTSDPQRFGECEWAEISGYEAKDRILLLENEWASCDYMPIGWRNPGWLINPSNVQLIEETFEYVAVHYEHNQGLNWNCKTFFGHDGIQQEIISIHNTTDDSQGNQTGMIMFQSHIAGKHNHNVWNEQNYEQLRMSLDHLFENYNIESKLLKECL